MRTFTSIFAIATCLLLADAAVIEKRQVEGPTCLVSIQAGKAAAVKVVAAIEKAKVETLELDSADITNGFDELFNAASNAGNICCYSAPANPQPVDDLVSAVTDISPALQNVLASFDRLIMKAGLNQFQLTALADRTSQLFDVFSQSLGCAAKLVAGEDQGKITDVISKLNDSSDKIEEEAKEATKDAPEEPTFGKPDDEPATEDAPKDDAPKEEASKEEAPKDDAPKDDAPKDDAPKEEASKEESPKDNAV